MSRKTYADVQSCPKIKAYSLEMHIWQFLSGPNVRPKVHWSFSIVDRYDTFLLLYRT